MKKEVINIIKIVGINLNEIFVEINTGTTVFNSIELRGDDVILHIFYEDMDIESNWNDLTMKQRKQILNVLRPLLYN